MNSIKTMNVNYIKYFIIVSLIICIVYIISKIINNTNLGDKLELVEDTENKVDDFAVSTDDYNSKDGVITDLLNLHNNANQNYYNEDNSDLTRIVKDINKVFKHLNPEQRIRLSKKKLDENYLQTLKDHLSSLTENVTLYDNKIHNVNTGIIFDTITSGDNILVKYNETNSAVTGNKCFEYNVDEKKITVETCDPNAENQKFKKINITNTHDFNDNISKNYSFAKTKKDTIPFAHNIIQLKCDNCDTDCNDTNGNFNSSFDCNNCETNSNCNKCCKKYKKCLTIVKNKDDNAYTTFIEDCNGRSAQQFYN